MTRPSTKQRGARNRDAIIRELLSGLRPGDLVPKIAEAGSLLGIDDTQACRHMRAAMAASGFVVERMGHGRRIVIEAPIPGLAIV